MSSFGRSRLSGFKPFTRRGFRHQCVTAARAVSTRSTDSNERDWTNPDAASNPTAYVQYLDEVFEGMGVSSKQDESLLKVAAVNYKHETYSLLGIQSGQSVLDLGCGTGTDVIALAELLHAAGDNGGRAVGVDISEVMVSSARQRWDQRLCNSESLRDTKVEVDFQQGDAQQLTNFNSASFDAVRSDRALQHVPDPQAAIHEMVRLVKPGHGRVVASEPDWETLVIDSASTTAARTTRRVANHFCDTRVNGWMGRSLPRLFREAGMVDIVALPMTAPVTDLEFIRAAYLDKAAMLAIEAGVVTEEESCVWMSELEDANIAGGFFSSLTIFTVSGRLPLADINSCK